MISKTLFLLDLDHTLIYGSYAPSETSSLLFTYSQFLKVYERPYAREFVKEIQSRGEIIVFTTAKEDYASMVSKELAIQPVQLLSRAACSKKGDSYRKRVRKNWLKKYSRIVVIDDSPQVWEVPQGIELEWIIPREFRGDANDHELLSLIENLKEIDKRDEL